MLMDIKGSKMIIHISVTMYSQLNTALISTKLLCNATIITKKGQT